MADQKKNPAAAAADPAASEAGQTTDYIIKDPETGDELIIERPEDLQKLGTVFFQSWRKAWETADGENKLDALAGLKIADLLPEKTRAALQEGAVKIKAVVTDELRESLEALRDSAEEMRRNMAQLQQLLDEIDALEPYLQDELKKPEYNGATIKDLLKDVELDGIIPPGSMIEKALQAARAARKKDPAKANITRTDSIDFPLDKVNNRVWRLLEDGTNGQLKYSFDVAKRGTDDSAAVYYAIDFENLKDVHITKRLQPFDKRAYTSIAALFNAGNDVITLTQIYYHMGYTGRPSAKHLEKIRQCVVKMLGAQIVIDNSIEAENYNYQTIKYRGALLPVEMGEVYNINGSLTNAAIHLLREPPLISFARERGQITTVKLKLLQSPVNKTDSNILIDDYLIERISRAKQSKQTACTVLLKTLFKHTNMDGKTQKDKQKRLRAPGTIEKYLTYYQQTGFIKGYSVTKEKIEIAL